MKFNGRPAFPLQVSYNSCAESTNQPSRETRTERYNQETTGLQRRQTLTFFSSSVCPLLPSKRSPFGCPDLQIKHKGDVQRAAAAESSNVLVSHEKEVYLFRKARDIMGYCFHDTFVLHSTPREKGQGERTGKGSCCVSVFACLFGGRHKRFWDIF